MGGEFRSREQWEDQLPHSILATMSRTRNVGDMEEKGRRDDCILFSVKSGESPTNYCFDSMKKIARFSPTILEVSSEAQCTYVVSSGIEGSWIYCFVQFWLNTCLRMILILVRIFWNWKIWKFLNLWFFFFMIMSSVNKISNFSGIFSRWNNILVIFSNFSNLLMLEFIVNFNPYVNIKNFENYRKFNNLWE